jgi:enoyl-[acyl-carrier protein] reductase II
MNRLETRITDLFGIRYPIVQGGMIWAAGYKLAAAVSNAGGLGLIGGGSMDVDLFRHHIRRCREKTDRPFGVNIPLMYRHADDLVRVALEEEVKIVFTSAGNPGKYAPALHQAGALVVHVVPTVELALKAESRGADAVVAEGTEAGGHNAPQAIATTPLVPQVADAVKIPVLAAGGIADGRGLAAALALGADGVQMGTRFACTVESSASPEYKRAIVEARDDDTILTLVKIGATRMIVNPYAQRLRSAEAGGADEKTLKKLRDINRAKRGIFEGDTVEGMLEAGQSAGLIREILTVEEVFQKLLREYEAARSKLPRLK